MSTQDSSLIDRLFEQLGGQSIQQLASSINSNPEQTKQGVQSAIPLLLSAASKKMQLPQGLQTLLNALPGQGSQNADSEPKEQWSVQRLLNMIPGMHHTDEAQSTQTATPGSGQTMAGVGNALEHLLGDKADEAASQVSQASGLDASQAMQLLKSVAPSLMTVIGHSDSAGKDDQASASSGGIGETLTKVLDQDGDGHLGLGDIMKAGSQIFNRPKQ